MSRKMQSEAKPVLNSGPHIRYRSHEWLLKTTPPNAHPLFFIFYKHSNQYVQCTVMHVSKPRIALKRSINNLWLKSPPETVTLGKCKQVAESKNSYFFIMYTLLRAISIFVCVISVWSRNTELKHAHMHTHTHSHKHTINTGNGVNEKVCKKVSSTIGQKFKQFKF